MNKDRHLKSIFIEFIEAFCRAADKISAPPTLNVNDANSSIDGVKDDIILLSVEERKAQPLVNKL